MKTTLELLRGCSEELRMKIVTQAYKDWHRHRFHNFMLMKYSSLHMMIDDAFSWENSNEGRAFWSSMEYEQLNLN